MKTVLRLSHLPPSLNAIWRHGRNRVTGKRQVYKIEEYNTWANAVGHGINRQMAGQPKWTSPVYLTIAMRRPDTRSDLDNRLKCLLDILQSHGVIKNDNLVNGINAYWTVHLPDDVAVEIAITAADPEQVAA